MTFIASVIARNGVAIVADSFGTQEDQVLDSAKLVEFLDKKKGAKNISIVDLVKLFEDRPAQTRNYQDKLVKFDDFSALTITGSSHLNNKPIKEILELIAFQMQQDPSYSGKKIEEIIAEICEKLKIEVLEQLQKEDVLRIEFIFSHFNKTLNKAQIFVIKIKSIDHKKFDPSDSEMVTFDDQSHLKIVSDGQDTFVDRLIFGSLYTNTTKVKEFLITYLFKKFKLKKAKKDEIVKEIANFDFMRELIQKDVFYIKFRELSVQEAVDLAALLIKIVMEIQIYTEKIPTVGGLIRLAVITKENGFEWVSGHTIIVPKFI